MSGKLSNDSTLFNKLSTFIESRATSSDTDHILFDHVEKIRDKDVNEVLLLGSGGFCNVFKARDKTNASKVYAIKRLKPSIKNNKKDLKIGAADLAIEAAILANLQHENIISLCGIKEGNMHQLRKSGSFFIALEPLRDTLEQRLQSWRFEPRTMWTRNRHMKIVDRLEHIALGIVRGMNYIHSNHILFRDLKPANIGFDKDTDEVKIFDFGLARTMRLDPNSKSPQKRLTKKIGTPRYMAPEIIRGAPYYDTAVDVYSFSIVLWQLVTDRTAFDDIITSSQLLTLVSKYNHRPPLGGVKGNDLKNIIKAGWSDKPSKRPSFSQIEQELRLYISKERLHNHQKEAFGFFRSLAHRHPKSPQIKPSIMGQTSSMGLMASC